jgi:hypothetical protein
MWRYGRSVGLLEDIDRVSALVAQGTAQQRAWFAEWQKRFAEAEAASDEQRCEDLADILILYERSELRPPAQYYTLEEVIDCLGFDRADFELGEADACVEGKHAPPVPSPGEDSFIHYVCPKCGQTLLVESLRQAAQARAAPRKPATRSLAILVPVAPPAALVPHPVGPSCSR